MVKEIKQREKGKHEYWQQVSVEGIEPSATRLKVGYSTTELHAHHLWPLLL